MSSDSKVDARHAQDDDGFENLPAVEKSATSAALPELKQPEIITAAAVKPTCFEHLLAVCLCWCAGFIYIAATTPATQEHKPTQYHVMTLLWTCFVSVLTWMVLLAMRRQAELDHAAVMGTLHASRLETYRLHQELRALHKKDK
jgi:hypothetical protein